MSTAHKHRTDLWGGGYWRSAYLRIEGEWPWLLVRNRDCFLAGVLHFLRDLGAFGVGAYISVPVMANHQEWSDALFYDQA